jgi:hypothetical protein
MARSRDAIIASERSVYYSINVASLTWPLSRQIFHAAGCNLRVSVGSQGNAIISKVKDTFVVIHEGFFQSLAFSEIICRKSQRIASGRFGPSFQESKPDISSSPIFLRTIGRDKKFKDGSLFDFHYGSTVAFSRKRISSMRCGDELIASRSDKRIPVPRAVRSSG